MDKIVIFFFGRRKENAQFGILLEIDGIDIFGRTFRFCKDFIEKNQSITVLIILSLFAFNRQQIVFGENGKTFFDGKSVEFDITGKKISVFGGSLSQLSDDFFFCGLNQFGNRLGGRQNRRNVKSRKNNFNQFAAERFAVESLPSEVVNRNCFADFVFD